MYHFFAAKSETVRCLGEDTGRELTRAGPGVLAHVSRTRLEVAEGMFGVNGGVLFRDTTATYISPRPIPALREQIRESLVERGL